MPVLSTQLNPRSAEFQANATAMQALVQDLRQQLEKVAQGGGEAARAKHTARGKLLPRERIRTLLDMGSPFLELAPLAAYGLYAEHGGPVPSAGIHPGLVPLIMHDFGDEVVVNAGGKERDFALFEAAAAGKADKA